MRLNFLSVVVITGCSMEEAMDFIVTGGTNAPEQVRFSNLPAAGKSPL